VNSLKEEYLSACVYLGAPHKRVMLTELGLLRKQAQKRPERNSLIENSMIGDGGCIFRNQTVCVASLVSKGGCKSFLGDCGGQGKL
jgi:hypothetical protein